MPGAQELLRERVGAYVAGGIPFAQFEDWFLDFSSDIEESGDPSLVEFAHRIQGILSEASHAHWSKDELRAALAGAVRVFDVHARLA